MSGTRIADEMQARARPGGWNTPCWAPGPDTSGGVTAGEGQLLYGLVRALRPATILEVGSGYGHGTLHLAAGCRDNGAGYVHTVEIHSGRRATAAQNAVSAGVDDIVSFYDAIPALAFDLVFLDAGHEAEDVRAYLAQATLAPGAVVVIHDAGYKDHARETAAAGGWQFVHLPTDSLFGMAILTRGAV